ncbi:MAG: cytochrome c biogenesis protein CcsA [Archaeoglobus sp.]|nr:cytochrome c biogenesis protein CcsA [Archaeoglobus sp.]
MDVGEILLLASLILVAYSVYAFYAGVKKRSADLLQNGEKAVFLYFLAILFSSLLLLSHFLSKDFSYEYVFYNSDSKLSLLLTVSAFWAGKEGSLLLWALFIATVNLFVLSDKKDSLTAYTLAISGLFLLLINILLLTTSNPFTRIPAQPEGVGLNPLLRTLEMVIHPPIVFAAYAGLLIPFAMAVSGYALGKDWEERAMKYLLPSWILLGLGIFVGGWWAYRTLGWGGFWGWDPVENSSMLPWLTSTLVFHTFYLQKRAKGSWIISANYYLLVLTFILVVFAAFVTRSGIVSSVHAFGEGPEGVIFLLVIVISAVVSIYVKRNGFRGGDELRISINRETSILVYLLVILMLFLGVLIGTLIPAFGFELGRKYYESIMFPVEIILFALFGLCIRLKWGWDGELREKFLIPSIIFLIASLSSFALSRSILASLAAGLFAFSLLNYLVAFYTGKMRFLRRYGAYVVHIGVMFLFIGSIGVWSLSNTQQFALSPGETATIDGYELKFVKLNAREDGEKFSIFAEIQIYENGKLIGTLKPEMREYKIIRQDRVVSSVEIMSFPLHDLYVSINGISSDLKKVGIEVHINRLANFVWLGMGLIVLGGLYSYLYVSRRGLSE